VADLSGGGITKKTLTQKQFLPLPPQKHEQKLPAPARTNSDGIGCDRTSTGTKYAEQYHPTNTAMFNDVNTCPKELLLCFHNLAWDFELPDGAGNLFDSINATHYAAVEELESLKDRWAGLEGSLDQDRWVGVKRRMEQSVHDAGVMRDKIMSYYLYLRDRMPPPYVPPPY